MLSDVCLLWMGGMSGNDILIGKDGQVKLRKPSPWNIREIARVIDKMPIRQQEIARKKQEKK